MPTQRFTVMTVPGRDPESWLTQRFPPVGNVGLARRLRVPHDAAMLDPIMDLIEKARAGAEEMAAAGMALDGLRDRVRRLASALDTARSELDIVLERRLSAL